MLSHINVCTGRDWSIRELAEMLADGTGFKGRLMFDTAKPDGTPRKLMDVPRFATMGWRPRKPLREGIEETYRWFVDHIANLRGA
jgi:nucleoside-diphosphate-sugar epimerase